MIFTHQWLRQKSSFSIDDIVELGCTRNVAMRKLEEIKYEYLNSFTTITPSEEEIKYYKITEILLKKWRTDECIKFKSKFNNELSKFKVCNNSNVENINMMDSIFHCFVFSTNDYVTEDFYYNEIFPIFQSMYENDMFDILTYENNRKQFYFANISETDSRSFPIHLYDGRKYTGIIPNLYYSKHLDVFEEVLNYFANVIYRKYGLYLQKAMNVIIDLCKEYNLPYIDLLEKAKEDAKRLDYPNNHNFKYQFFPRLNVKWED